MPDDVVEVGPFAGPELGMERFAIDGDFEGAAPRRNEGERADAIAEFKNLGRQTDGLRRVISDHAIFDPDFAFHATLLSEPSLAVECTRSSCSPISDPEELDL